MAEASCWASAPMDLAAKMRSWWSRWSGGGAFGGCFFLREKKGRLYIVVKLSVCSLKSRVLGRYQK